MNTSICDENVCWLCSTPAFCCNCDSPWSTSTSQVSFCTFGGSEEPEKFDVDEPACTIKGSYFFSGPLENSGLDIDVMAQCLGRGSQRPCVVSTPKNNGHEKWESPGAFPPPESSSPVGIDADSLPFSMDPALLVSCREDVKGVDPRCFCGPLGGGQWQVKALFNDLVESNAPIFLTTTSMSLSLPLSADTSERSSSMLDEGAAQELLDESQSVTGKTHVADTHDVCMATTRTVTERTNECENPDETVLRSSMPASRKRAICSGPTILDLAISTELGPVSLDNTGNDGARDATTTSGEASNSVPSKMPLRESSVFQVSCPAQLAVDNRLKRRLSSFGLPPECKKVKLDRSVSHVSCASDLSAQSKYSATRPASLRRAQSLKSEASAISACSEKSMDSLSYPSPLSTPTSRPCPDKEYPPTVPSTPLPTSADYARSRANPLARTLVVYRRRSLEVPKIPPVPIIAPPPHVPPTIVRCAEDHAIDRLEALLLRERSERERDGLNAHDEKRTALLKVLYPTDLAFSRRDSANTTDASDDGHQWEEESTCSTTELQESQESVPSVNLKIVSEQQRLANRGIWSNAFGIPNNFREEVTGWILEKVPPKPVPLEGDERRSEFNLYDQLMNSRHTRFHAAQLFHRYFLLPEKVKNWRKMYKHEHPEREFCGLHDDSDYEKSIWDLAVACMALSVKLHRDCFWPLGPVFAANFLAMAPYSMTLETFELAQRDVLYTFQFQLGSCTPQDVLDELWIALPTLRKAAAPIGWAVVQCVTWDTLFKLLLEPDMLQYPVTLLTAAALVDSLAFALSRQYRTEAEANICKCKALAETPATECDLDDIEATWRIHDFEASRLVDDVISDVQYVLHLSPMELDECRKWLSGVAKG